ncbi:MAG: hypothetical protein M3268_09115, partial [Acidobacteriota bacterium]|nr:hypothetical protein [Acidobacteriota bacterium]
GSGAPLFGQSGRVIGVNFAAFTGMPDTNFAVPVRSLYPLLERAGWVSPEPNDEEDADSNTNTAPAKDARPTVAPAPPSR